MVFERFVSEARDEPPDIDVDFEHERREEVIQHIYDRYGRHRAGLCATVIHYRGKRAIREVGARHGPERGYGRRAVLAALGFFSPPGLKGRALREIGLDPDDRAPAPDAGSGARDQGFPRHLSPACRRLRHHRGPAGRAGAHRERHDGGPHRHLLGQGRHRRAGHPQGRRAGARHADLHPQGLRPDRAITGTDYTLATLPPEDPARLRHAVPADSVGVFQVESRAQMNFLPRMRPRCFYDLVIEVAIIRPGPIQGDMVHPYIRRRNGEEAVDLPLRRAGAGAGQDAGRAACSRNRRCRSPSSARASPRRRPTACAGRWPPSRSTAMSASSARGSCAAWRATATTPISPSAAFPRSRASALTAFPKATRRASRCWSMPRPGSSGTTPASSPARC